MVVRGTEMFVGASVGIALATSGDERPEELLRDADAAMHHAKEAGRGRVEVFDDTMRTRAVTAHTTENALHRALERGEFRLFFQPIVGLADARCVGAEALRALAASRTRAHRRRPSSSRWPRRPASIVPMGWWVHRGGRRGTRRAGSSSTRSRSRSSINLSARQLVQPDLAERVAEVIAQTGVRAVEPVLRDHRERADGRRRHRAST